MDLSLQMDATARSQVEAQTRAFNQALNQGREVNQSLDRDDFLQILITQLRNQDPTSPMEDKEFIAQMAQFSTLEQMTNMSSEFNRLHNLLSTGQASSMLGKTVELIADGRTIQGVVSEVTQGDIPMVRVNDQYYEFQSVERIFQ